MIVLCIFVSILTLVGLALFALAAVEQERSKSVEIPLPWVPVSSQSAMLDINTILESALRQQTNERIVVERELASIGMSTDVFFSLEMGVTPQSYEPRLPRGRSVIHRKRF